MESGQDIDVKKDITNVWPRIRWAAIEYLIGDYGYKVVTNRKLRQWGLLKYRRIKMYR